MNHRGFTLIELIVVITITGILAATLTIFFKPAIDSYFDTRRRADLTDMADTALRRMAKDIRGAVPRSVNWVSNSCIQLVPSIAGGRYRMEQDSVWDAANPTNKSASLDVRNAPADWIVPWHFDVLSPLVNVTKIATGDWLVIDNQNGDDVYTGVNRGKVNGVTAPTAALGSHRIELTAPVQFPAGYDGGRFVVVPKAEQTIFFTCQNRTLYRGVANTTTTAFTKLADSAACAAAGGVVLATDVESCKFVYNPNAGATPQSGFVWMTLELKRSGESVVLAHGVHVDNVP